MRPFASGWSRSTTRFSGQNYLPYSVALLQTYVQKMSADPGLYEFLPPLYKRVRIADAVEPLKDADLVGFSTYVWNGRISLEIARRLKALRPGIAIVFGGPHVPDQPEAFLRANPQIDLAVHNEGERTFLKLLESFADREPGRRCRASAWSRPTAASCAIPTSTACATSTRSRRPSSKARSTRSMAANPSESWIGLWETNRGCPFRCTFCDWGSATATKVTKFDDGTALPRGRLVRRQEDRIHLLLRRQLRHPAARPRHRQVRRRHQAATPAIRVALSVQNTKNATERAYETQKTLADAGLNKGVALRCRAST